MTVSKQLAANQDTDTRCPSEKHRDRVRTKPIILTTVTTAREATEEHLQRNTLLSFETSIIRCK